MFSFSHKTRMPSSADALTGRTDVMPVSDQHFVNGHSIKPPFPEQMQIAMFGLGCFWGAEHKFWAIDSVYSTAVGYAGGYTPNPKYDEVCTGRTGHNEVVRVVFNKEDVAFESLLTIFWESHDPTQGMRQGNDTGTQYRSGIYTYNDAQQQLAEYSRDQYQILLTAAGHGEITTEIIAAPEFYYAEDYHQQYLAKNPGSYCGLGGTGISCQV